MKIYVAPNTAGRYGGGLKGNLRYLGRLIQNELDNSSFKTSFDELSLILSYPPMYVLPGVAGMEIVFKKNYDTLPYSRLNRRYKRIDIKLKAPEFSEHFDKDEQKKYKHQFDIESQFKNISETNLAKILIDKCIEAGEIITSKLKKDDVFDLETFKNVLINIRQKIGHDFLQSLNSVQKKEVSDETLKRAIAIRERRKLQNKPKDKLIRDLRVYCNGLPNKALSPYDYQYTEIFLNLLQKEKFLCPGYDHLYIQVAKTMEDALKSSLAAEDWYVNGLSVIDFEHYTKQSNTEKEKIVFNTIVAGLRDIATIDNLDQSVIEKVISEIQQKGLETELVFRTVENSSYVLKITYFSRSSEEECPVYFNLTDKTTNQTKRLQIGKADKSQIYFWLQKVTLTNKLIKVKSGDSIAANVWLKNKPKTMEFAIAELMK